MTQRLKAHTAFAEDSSLVANIHLRWLKTNCHSRSGEANSFVLPSTCTHARMRARTHSHAHAYTHIHTPTTTTIKIYLLKMQRSDQHLLFSGET